MLLILATSIMVLLPTVNADSSKRIFIKDIVVKPGGVARTEVVEGVCCFFVELFSLV